MTRIQFWILTVANSLVALLLILQLIFANQVGSVRGRAALIQQTFQEGQAARQNLQQLANRIYQVSQTSNDQGLKDLMTRQHISLVRQPGAPAPAGTPPTTHAPASTPAPAAR